MWGPWGLLKEVRCGNKNRLPGGGPRAWQLQGFHHKAKDRGKCPCEYFLRSQEEVDLLLKGSEFQKGQRGGVVRKVGQAWWGTEQ